MTYKEKIIATAYTGTMFVDGDHLGDVYKYEEEKLNHGVLDIMHADMEFRNRVRAAVKDDFLKMINAEPERQLLTKEWLQEMIDGAAASADAYLAIGKSSQHEFYRGQAEVYTRLLHMLYGLNFGDRVFPLDENKRQEIIDSVFEFYKPK